MPLAPVPLTPVAATPPPPEGHGLMVRVALLEARVRLLVLAVEGMIVAGVTALIAYFFGK